MVSSTPSCSTDMACIGSDLKCCRYHHPGEPAHVWSHLMNPHDNFRRFLMSKSLIDPRLHIPRVFRASLYFFSTLFLGSVRFFWRGWTNNTLPLFGVCDATSSHLAVSTVFKTWRPFKGRSTSGAECHGWRNSSVFSAASLCTNLGMSYAYVPNKTRCHQKCKGGDVYLFFLSFLALFEGFKSRELVHRCYGQAMTVQLWPWVVRFYSTKTEDDVQML